MFIPDTSNLLLRKQNIIKQSDLINTLSFKHLKEALEVVGLITLTNHKETITIDKVYGISMIYDFYYAFHDENIMSEINVYYWEDYGHMIDIKMNDGYVEISDCHSMDKNVITMDLGEFSNQFSRILATIYELCFAVYYPTVEKLDFFESIEKMSQIELNWKKQ